MQTKQSIQGVFRIYRLALTGLLAITALFDQSGELFSELNGTVFTAFSLAWFLMALTSGLLSRKYPETTITNTTSLTIDMLVLAALGWATGGVSSGLFFLMLPSAAIAGVMLPTQFALLVAAIGSIGALWAQGLLFAGGQQQVDSLFPAGLLGFLLFACTAAFKALEKRLLASEEKAQISNARAEEYRQLSEAVIKQMLSGMLVVDENARITMINPSAERMLAATNSITSRLTGSDLGQFPKLQRIYEDWKSDMNAQVPRFVHDYTGMEIQPLLRVISQGLQERVLITLEETRLVRQQAQQAKVLALGKLSASLAHEVRNPLSAINQANDLLNQSPNLEEEDRKLVNIISRHCERMDQTIGVTSQLSRQLEPSMASIDLEPWMQRFVSEYQEAQTEPCQIHLKLKSQSIINFDPQHLTQILRNLVDNGLKYSSAACEKRDVAILSSYDRSKRLIFVDVHDRGLGIPKDEVDEAFTPFYSKSGGPGVGLYVCRELCEANFASINYLYKSDDQESGFFRITAWIQQPNQ